LLILKIKRYYFNIFPNKIYFKTQPLYTTFTNTLSLHNQRTFGLCNKTFVYFPASWAPSGNDSGGAPQLKGARWFSYDELKKCTCNFSQSNEIGSGGYGKVYIQDFVRIYLPENCSLVISYTLSPGV
jgi:hypothetical protein